MNPNQKATVLKEEISVKPKLIILIIALGIIHISNAQTPAASNTLNNSGVTSIASTTASAFKLSINGTAKYYGTGDGTGTAGTMVTSPTIFLQNTTASTGRQYSINSNNIGLLRMLLRHRHSQQQIGLLLIRVAWWALVILPQLPGCM